MPLKIWVCIRWGLDEYGDKIIFYPVVFVQNITDVTRTVYGFENATWSDPVPSSEKKTSANRYKFIEEKSNYLQLFQETRRNYFDITFESEFC